MPHFFSQLTNTCDLFTIIALNYCYRFSFQQLATATVTQQNVYMTRMLPAEGCPWICLETTKEVVSAKTAWITPLESTASSALMDTGDQLIRVFWKLAFVSLQWKFSLVSAITSSVIQSFELHSVLKKRRIKQITANASLALLTRTLTRDLKQPKLC